MKANKQIIIDEIVKLITEGKAYAEVLSLIEPKCAISRATFTRYWKTANETVTRDRSAMNELAKDANLQLEIESTREALLTGLELKRIIFSRIKKIDKKEDEWNSNDIRLAEMGAKILKLYEDNTPVDTGTKIIFLDSLRKTD